MSFEARHRALSQLGDEPTIHHRLTLRTKFGSLALNVTMDLSAPWTILFGPSGSGKSTLLRFMAGTLPLPRRPPAPVERAEFSRCESGQWQILTGAADHEAPERRAIALAPQAASLFPHLSVARNVGFAQDVANRPRSSTPGDPERAAALLEQARDLFDLQDLWARSPSALSGGERQRVNLARAFARGGTRLLLLDEPFAGMDRARRDRILPRLRAAAADRHLPVVSVTHDLEEAFLLDADVARLDAGRLLDQGPASRILAAERLEVLGRLS